MSGQTLVRVPCPLCAGSKTKPERIVRGFALERCRKCGLVFANPQLPATELTEGYEERENPEELLAFYERVTTPERVAEYDRILDDLATLMPGRGRLLDFGSGPGYFVQRAERRGWEAHGVEVGKWAREAAIRRGLKNFHSGLLADQSFPDGTFDVITVNQVLEHLPTPRVELAELRRVLRPGGILYANVPNYRTLPIMLDCDDFELNYPMAHVNFFTPKTLSNLFARSGLEVLRTITSGGVKWENLLGHRTISEEVRANHGEPAANGRENPGAEVTPRAAASVPLLKQVAMPLVKKVFYQWGKVGITLEIFSRKAR